MIRKIALGALVAGALITSTVPTAEAATSVSPNASVTALARALHCTHIKVQKKDSSDPVPPAHEITCTTRFGSLDIATWKSHAKMEREFKQTSALLTLVFPGIKFYTVAGNRWAITDYDNNNMSTRAKVKRESAYSKKIATKVHARIGGRLIALGG